MSGDVVVVGVGPRGTIVLTRLAAHLRHQLARSPGSVPAIRLHLVEPTEFGAGAVWRTDQPRDMCMNTLAAGSTLFTDESWTGAGPRGEGPTFHAWAERVRPTRRTDDGVDLAGFADELDAMLPWSHPSRALFGHYCAWAFRRAVADLVATGRVTVVEHPTRAAALRPAADGYVVDLADGTSLPARAVVLALGWTPVAPEPSKAPHPVPEERRRSVSKGRSPDRRSPVPEAASASERLEGPGLTRVHPDSPIDQDLSAVHPGQHVLVRGLGMGFFDTMSRLTIGRGGRFEPTGDPSAPLVYRPSGREPVLHVASDRGVPFLAKTRYGSMPPKPAMENLRAAIAAAPRPLPVAELWPAILRDAITEHARALVRTRAGDLVDAELLVPALESLPADADLDEVRAVAARHIPVGLRFEPTDCEDPAGRVEFAGPDDVDAFVADLLRRDLAEANLGHDSAVKAGLWAISVARGPVGLAAAFDGVDATGDRDLGRVQRWGGLVGSGPPAFRNEQLLALHVAGLVHFVGPRVRVEVRDGRFEMWSPRVPGSAVRSTVLVDAWMRSPHAGRAADPLVSGLVDEGLARAFTRPGPDGEPVASGSFDVAPDTGELVAADGERSEGLFMIGIPVDGARRDTIQAPVPGIDSNTLHEADGVAVRVLELVAEATRLQEAS